MCIFVVSIVKNGFSEYLTQPNSCSHYLRKKDWVSQYLIPCFSASCAFSDVSQHDIRVTQMTKQEGYLPNYHPNN